MMRTLTRILGMAIFLLSALLSPSFLSAQDSPKQDMKDAGNETKEAAKDTGRATKHAAKKTGRAIKKGTNKAAEKTEEGARKVKDKTDPNEIQAHVSANIKRGKSVPTGTFCTEREKPCCEQY